jgi:hypothetical protein
MEVNNKENNIMKKLIYIFGFLFLTACCGKPGVNGLDGIKGDKGDTGNVGAPGVPGQDGLPGSDGHSALFSQGAASISLCANGGVVLNAGVDMNDDDVLQTSEIKSTSVTCNGLNGAPAVPNPFDVISLIDPCGATPGHYNEVFIKFTNGTMLASFSDSASGNNTRFSVLVPGSYVTTDGTGCHFTVNSGGVITNEHF